MPKSWVGKTSPWIRFTCYWERGKNNGVWELRTRLNQPLAVREGFLEEGIPKLSPDRETEVREADKRSEMCPRFV